MASKVLTEYEDVYYSDLAPTGGETANSIYGLGGNDQITGNGYIDYIHGGNGDDKLYGMGGDDILDGGSGADTLSGGYGDDLLLGGSGDDILYGGPGEDRLWGGEGNDHYQTRLLDGGFDTINDDKSPTGQTGHGGGDGDSIYFDDVVSNDLRFFQFDKNLVITSSQDIQDGTINSGVIVEDFYLGGNNTIEYVGGSDGQYWDITGFLA